MVTGDHAFAFHALDPVGAGRGRQADALGQFRDGNAAFPLQDIQDFQVDTVEVAHFTSGGRKRAVGREKPLPNENIQCFSL
ncbi:hypothetical protein WJ972_04295 [Achromobacter insuavis]